MKQYLRERERTGRRARTTGILLTVGVHLLALGLLRNTGLDYIYPPLEEKSFVLDFQQDVEIEKPEEEPQPKGKEPQAEKVDKTAPVELVKKAESPHESTKPNKTPAVKQNNHGDVEVPAQKPNEEPKLDPRASFPGMAKKDTSVTAPHGAKTASNDSKEGQPDGNSKSGKVEGKPNAQVEGRSVLGVPAKPVYNVQDEGTVVVSISVDQYGNVTKATAGATGTTVNNPQLWQAAREAAFKTKFNLDADAPAEQQGKITYKFKLK